jgi:uncharacterized protein YhaN
MSKKVENIKRQLNIYRNELSKYKQLIMEDGIIDSTEQANLNKMIAVIDECEHKIDSLSNNNNEASSNPNADQQVTTNVMTRINELKNKIEEKLKTLMGNTANIQKEIIQLKNTINNG